MFIIRVYSGQDEFGVIEFDESLKTETEKYGQYRISRQLGNPASWDNTKDAKAIVNEFSAKLDKFTPYLLIVESTEIQKCNDACESCGEEFPSSDLLAGCCPSCQADCL